MAFDLTLNRVTTSTLVDYTRRALIVSPLRNRDTAGIIGELSQALQSEGCIPDLLPFYHTALNQELLSSSVLASGIAFPHARLSGVKQLQFAFGRVPESVAWGAKSTWKAQLIFLLAVPATDAARYLHLLASLARLGQQPEQVAELRAADNPDAILAVLGKIRMRQG